MKITRQEIIIHKNLVPIKSVENGPTVQQMVQNLGVAIVNWSKNGFGTVPKEEYEKRMSICQDCEFWQANARAGLGKCNHSQCGCTKIKQWLPTEKCPINKWDIFENLKSLTSQNND